MGFRNPHWLLLAIPLAAAFLYWRPASRTLAVLRTISLALVALALADPYVRVGRQDGVAVVVADRSHSMPPEALKRQNQDIARVVASGDRNSRTGVIGFGMYAHVEAAPGGQRFASFSHDPRPDHSNLAGALETALSLLPGESSGRILVLSDGRWTGKDPFGPAARAGARGIAVDYLFSERRTAGDIAVRRFQTPLEVHPRQAFLLTAWIDAPEAIEATYRLTRGTAVLSQGTRALQPGSNRLMFRDIAGKPGVMVYRLEVDPVGVADPVPENNRAKALVSVKGNRPLLVLAREPSSGLADLLRQGGLTVDLRTPQTTRFDLDTLAGYSALLVENVPAGTIGMAGMEVVAEWVRETGRGLVMTGGRNSYGPGGYFRSPLEEVLPVSMELRREHRKLSLAIVVAMDRSGSMSAPAGMGKTKMDLANLGAVQVLDLLSEEDELGVIAVDSEPHTVVKLDRVSKVRGARGRILQIESMGGGIYVYNALNAAADMLARSECGTRHIILFSDARDSEQPGKYQRLLEKCRKAGITVSVVGLGTPQDVDALLLQDIAMRGEGRCFFTETAQEIPRLFAQDTFSVARNTFIEEPTPSRLTGAMATLAGRPFPGEPTLGGYNLCYLRPEATLGGQTLDEYSAPTVAFWHVGAGRALCYTGEADGEFTGPIASWPKVGDFFTSMARWAAGGMSNLPAGMLITQTVGGGTCDLRLHLDPERQGDPFLQDPSVRSLSHRIGRKPESATAPMQWLDSDTLRSEIPLGGGETVLPTVVFEEDLQVALPPVCLPYSPEYAPAEPGRGIDTLRRIAAVTGGRERIDLSTIWEDMPRSVRGRSLAPWLVGTAMLVFLLEILQRRSAVLSPSAVRVGVARQAQAAGAALTARRSSRRVRPKQQAPDQDPEPSKAPPPEPPAEPPARKTFNALREAARRADERTGRPKT